MRREMRPLIIAGSYDQYRNSKSFNVESKYIGRVEDIYGYENTTLTYIGTWYERWKTEDLEALEFYCETHNIVCSTNTKGYVKRSKKREEKTVSCFPFKNDIYYATVRGLYILKKSKDSWTLLCKSPI